MPDPARSVRGAVTAGPQSRASAPLRVLLINFTLDEASPVLAWQAAVAKGLARRVAAVHVFTEWLGAFEAPEGLTLDAMPHCPLGIPRRLGSTWLMLPSLLRRIATFRPDACFIHMTHRWGYRIAPYLRARGIPVLLWYAHGSTPIGLRLATLGVSRVVTSTPEGFRIDTPKKRVIGQAIDTEMFTVPSDRAPAREIVTVGRVSRRKRSLLLIEAMAQLVRRPGFSDAQLIIVGPELTSDDKAYRSEIEARIAELGIGPNVRLAGPMPQAHTAGLYRTAALHVNVSETGSMDKTVMEALSCGCPVLTSNEAFFDVLARWPDMLIPAPTAETLAERMAMWLDGRAAAEAGALRSIVAGHHDLDGYIDRIVAELGQLVAEARTAGRRAS